jgi:hypothetical protein
MRTLGSEGIVSDTSLASVSFTVQALRISTIFAAFPAAGDAPGGRGLVRLARVR